MISLQRSMHSSQMYTPGPAMSFLTCFWLLPQNEHFSRSPPSPMRATQILLYMGPPRRPAERPAVPGEQVPRGGHELAYRRYRVRGSMDTIKPLRRPGGRTASVRLGRHYLDRLLRAALDHGQHLIDDAVLLGILGGEELVALDVVPDRLFFLAGVPGQDDLHRGPHAQNLAGLA